MTTAYVLGKALSLGFIAYGVINNTDMSATVRSLIVAVVSGLLGIAGVYLGGKMSLRTNKEILERASENQELANENRKLLEEVKALSKSTNKIVDSRQEPR